MRIHITSNEIYEINIPMDKEFSKQEFSIFVSRLNQIMKLLGKDEVLEAIKSPVQERKKYTKSGLERKERKNARPFTKSREIALQVLHTHYWGTKEQKEEIAKQLNMTWENINKAIYYITKKWKIQSQEIGMKAFPVRKKWSEFWHNKEAWRI
jgi:hypothetical protein